MKNSKPAAINLEEDAKSGPSDSSLATLKALVDLQIKAEQDLVEAEDLVKLRKQQLRKIVEEEVPNFFDTIGGLKEITLTDGRVVRVAEEVYPSIKKENQPKAFDWLRKHHFGDLIKNKVEVSFKAGEDEKAEELQALLVENQYTDFEQKEFVHPQTLGAFVREQLKKGADLPSTIEIQRVRKSEVKKPK